MAAQKYWRLQVAATSSTDVQLAEVAFLDAAGVDLSIGGTTIASSVYNGSYIAANAFDKNPSTRWCTTSGQFPGWIGYIHAIAVDVVSVRVTWDPNASYLPASVSAISVLSSDDGVTWGAPMLVALVSGALTASTTCELLLIAAKPLIVVDAPKVAHVASGAYTGPYGHAVTAPQAARAGDYKTGLLGKGVGTVYGTTEIKGTPDAPLRARVRLIRERDGLVYRETWSDAATGAYRFDNVDELETYTVLSYHPTRDKRAVVADNLVPEVMP